MLPSNCSSAAFAASMARSNSRILVNASARIISMLAT